MRKATTNRTARGVGALAGQERTATTVGRQGSTANLRARVEAMREIAPQLRALIDLEPNPARRAAMIATLARMNACVLFFDNRVAAKDGTARRRA